MKVSMKQRANFIGWIFSAPSFLWVAAIIVYPVVVVIGMSFFDIRMIQKEALFVGLQNYVKLANDPLFREQILNTLVWTVSNILLITLIGLAIAFFLDIEHPVTNVLRRLILYPWIFPVVASALMFRLIFEPESGILNYILLKGHLIEHKLTFLSDPTLAMPCVVLFNVWRWSPFMVVVALAALQTMPLETLEAATIDGANALQGIWHVKLPHIFRTVTVQAFIVTMWVINMFPPIWLLTEGGPARVTETLPIAIYKDAFRLFSQSFAAAKSVLLLVLTMCFALGYITILRRTEIAPRTRAL